MTQTAPAATLDLTIDGVTFDGFDQGFADRAALAFETGLRAGLAKDALAERLAGRTSLNLGAVVLDLPQTSTPADFGTALARAILEEVAR